MKIFHLKISSCPFWDTCTYEGLRIVNKLHRNPKVCGEKYFFLNFQNIWKGKINYEAMNFSLIIQFILPSRWEFLSVTNYFSP